MTQPDPRERTPKWLWVVFGLGFCVIGALAYFFYWVTHTGAVG
jgi:hypothetical protein